MTKYLITGASGFLGKSIVKKLLKNNQEVKVLIPKKEKIENFKECKIFHKDINDDLTEVTKGIEVIIHCAAYMVTGKIADKEEAYNTNVRGTKNIIEAAIKNRVKRFIHISSVAAMGETKEADEENMVEPTSIYGKTKLEGEKIVLKYKNKINATVIRPSIIYGPGKLHAINKIIEAIAKKRFVIFGSGKNKFNLIYIDDIAEVIIKTIDIKKTKGQVYIISSTVITLKELCEIIAKKLNKKRPISLPIWLGKLSAIILEEISKRTRLKTLLTISMIEYFTSDRSFITEKGKRDISYNSKIDIETGLENSIDWLKKEKIID